MTQVASRKFWRPRSPEDLPPGGAQPPVALRRAAQAWLVALGVAAIVIGGHDLLVATEISVRLWGTLVFGAGAVLVAGAWGLHRDTPAGRALAMVAALLGIALGALTFLAQVVSDEPDRRLLAWGAIVALSAGTARVVHRLTPDAEHGVGVWKQLPVLKSVVSVGVVISLGQFWYTAIYVPTTAPANLTIEPRLQQETVGDHVVLHATVTIHNTSGMRVDVLASYLDVAARNAKLRDTRGAAEKAQVDEAFDSQVVDEHASQTLADRYTEMGAAESVLHGSPVPAGTYLEPGETITQSYTTWVPKGRYAIASADLQLTTGRASALALETVAQPKPVSGPETSTVLTPIPEPGWLRGLTRGDRYVRVDYDDADPGKYPRVRFTPSRTRAPKDFDRRMWRLYGVARVEAETETTIPPA